MTTPIRQIADRVWDRLVEVEAAYRVQRGLPVERFRGHTDATAREDAAYAEVILAELAGATPDNEDDRLTAGYLEHGMGSYVSANHHLDHGFTITPYQQIMQAMVFQQVLQAFSGSPDSYLSLVADWRDAVTGWRGRIDRQRQLGILLPRPALAGVRESLTRGRRAMLTAIEGSAPAAADTAGIVVEVGATYDRLLGYLDDRYAADAPRSVGFSQWAGGADYYRSMVRRQTASSVDPEQFHRTGLEQVAVLTSRMAEVRAGMGFTGTEAEFHAQLADGPRVHTGDPAEVDALFLGHMAALEPLIGDYFSALPKAPYGVMRLGADKEAGMTYGYYDPPTPAEPVGYYRWNGANLESKSLLTYAALIFHELAPGHHFHVARQSENTELPDIRREGLEMESFNEGWAEYASGLGWEMGLYADPLDAYGRLVHERFTAQRLVVDTGLNLLGWDLERAAAYARENTTDSPAQIASEMLRYSTDLPGQALAYRAGYLELMRIRGKAERAFGQAFDIREFHEHVIGAGALPFPVLDGHIDRWIAGTLA